jgi:hypothetical protein
LFEGASRLRNADKTGDICHLHFNSRDYYSSFIGKPSRSFVYFSSDADIALYRARCSEGRSGIRERQTKATHDSLREK